MVFLDLLAGYAQRYGLWIWGHCLMSNHFHLVEVPAHEGAAARVLGSSARGRGPRIAKKQAGRRHLSGTMLQ